MCLLLWDYGKDKMTGKNGSGEDEGVMEKKMMRDEKVGRARDGGEGNEG
jgi:hypothetical protein